MSDAVSTSPTYTSTSYVRRYDPRVVALVGAHEAIVFSQIEYWLERPGGKDHDGHHWVYKSCEELASDTGLSKSQVKRTIAKLRAAGLLVSIENPINGWDRTPWYRVNDDHAFVQETKSSHARDVSIPSRDEFVPSIGRSRPVDKTKLSRRRDEPGSAIPERTTNDNERESTPPDTPRENSSARARDSLGGRGSDHNGSSARKTRRGVPLPQLSTQPEPAQESSGVDSPQERKTRMDGLKERAARAAANIHEKPVSPAQARINEIREAAR